MMVKLLRLKTMLLLCALTVGGVNSAWADTYEQLTSIANIDESAEYVLGVDGTGFHYEGTSSWGKTALPSAQTPIKYTLKKANDGKSFTAQATISSTTYYLQVLTSNTFSMATSTGTNTDLIIGTTQVSGTNYAVANKTTTTRHLRINGTSGLRSYASTTGTMAFFYKVISTHTLTYSATNGSIAGVDAGSNAVVSGASVAEGATVTLTATPADGYTFSSWSVEGTGSTLSSTSTNPTTFTMGTANATVTANFTPEVTSDYITVSPTTKDMTSASGNAEFTISTDQTLDSDPTQFYTTADGDVTTTKPAWITSASYDEGTLTLTVAANAGAARTAYFKVEKGSVKSSVITINQAAHTYAIEQKTAPATAHGTITFSPTSPVDAGAEVTLTATPAEGYSFTADSWTFYKESGEDWVEDNSFSVTDSKITMPSYALKVDATFAAVAVTGVTLNKTSLSMGVGDEETLTATVAPANALNKAVTWTSSNTSVATVSAAGVVTAVAAGSATITVTTTDGGYTANCTVTAENAVTFTAGTDKGSTTTNNSADEISKSGVTISSTDAALAQTEYRLYSGSTTTISTNSGKVTKIEFTMHSNYAATLLSTTTGTYNSSTATWTGVASSVAFSASAQARVDKIKVYYATTATPTFSVAAGEYDEAKSVTISCATDGATIYYTTDGTTPTSSSTAYSSAISITTTTTLKAIAIKDGVNSDVASATYTMNRPAAPAFDVAAGVFDAAFNLHLSTETDGATIYYTTDGTTPTTSSSAYSDKVAISAATTTVKAIAVKNGLTSDVSSATYTYDARTTPTFTLSTTSLDLKVNETSCAVTLTTNSDGTVAFTCADAHVTLTGTGTSRTISANAAGEYTVNVSVTGSASYKDAAGTITVNVTKKATTMVLTPSFTSKDLYVTTSGSLTGVPQYNSSDIAGAEVTYSSSDETVATINASTGAVTFRKAGTTTLTASYAGTAEYEDCEETYVLTLEDTTPQATEVGVSFNNSLYGTSYTGANAAGSGSEKRTVSGSTNNILVTVYQGSGTNLYINNDETRIYNYGTITFEAPVGYVMTKIVFNNGTAPSNWSVTASPGTLSTATWTGSASEVVFSASARSDFENATVTLAPTVTITAAKYATYCSQHDLDFSATGIEVYKAKVNTATNMVTMTEVTGGKVPANTGVVLYKDVDEATTIAVPVTTGVAALSDNDLVGTTVRTLVSKTAGGKYNYIMQLSGGDIVFNMATTDGAYMPANRAYLSTTVDASAGGARLSVVFEDDETTGLKNLTPALSEGEGVVYNLNGQRVEKPRKGLFIVNGKKVFVR